MTKYSFYLLLLFFFTACNNESSKTKEQVKDSVVTDQDSAVVTGEIAPLDMDSMVSTEPVAASTGPVTLKFDLPVGKSYSYAATIDMNQEMPGQKIKSTMLYNYTLKVNKGSRGVKEMTSTYGDMSMHMEMNGKKMSFGAGQKEEPLNPFSMIGKMFAAMKGKSFSMEVNEEGDIINVKGFDKIADAVIAELNIPEASREKFEESFKSQFNEKSVKQMFSESFNIFPGKKISPGDSWQKKAALPLASQSVDVNTTYTLKELRGGNYIIDASTKYINGGSKPVIGKSRLIVDAKTGLVLQLDGEQKMEGSNTVISRSRIRSKEI